MFLFLLGQVIGEFEDYDPQVLFWYNSFFLFLSSMDINYRNNGMLKIS
jgi:hypothetical protein